MLRWLLFWNVKGDCHGVIRQSKHQEIGELFFPAGMYVNSEQLEYLATSLEGKKVDTIEILVNQDSMKGVEAIKKIAQQNSLQILNLIGVGKFSGGSW